MFRIATGSAVLLFGLWFFYLAVTETWWLLIHGSVISAIGIAILLNKKEDDIEEIKSSEDNKE